ncbi:guanylate-binding protein [Blastocladiella britannica]|nr:guanylate-binding protein [Blastocladiella britannica]
MPAATEQEPQRPQLLISLSGKISDPNTKFVINDGAVSVLEALPQPIGVISVAGLYRTGKSFILNQLAGRVSGFDIGASIQPKTQGIWMWVLDPAVCRRRKLPEGMSIVLLDTEGLGSFTKTETHDVKIFSLAVLLSSFMIYNSLGTIDDTAVENMSLILNLTRSIKDKVHEGPPSGSMLSLPVKVDPSVLRPFFPRFLWLLRDFTLELEIEGRKISEDEYLENSLKPLEGKDPDILSKNKVRDTIRAVFEQRSCFTLKRPVDDEDDLQNLSEISNDKFRKDYLQEVERLIQYVYRNTPPKSLYGTPLSGSVFVGIMKQYVMAINTGSVPVISSAWDSVLQQKMEMALEAAREAVADTLPKPTDLTSAMVLLEPTGPAATAQAAANAAFLTTAVVPAMTPPILDRRLGEIRDSAYEAFATLGKAVESGIADHNRAAAARAARQVQTAVERAESVDAIRAAAAAAETSYLADAKGENRVAQIGELHAVGWTSMVLGGAATVVESERDRVDKEWRGKYDVMVEEKTAEYDKVMEMYQTVDAEWKKEQANAKQLREQATELRYEIMGHQKTIKSLEGQVADMSSTNAMLTSDLGALRKKFDETTTKLQSVTQQLEQTTTKLETTEKKRGDLEKRMTDLDAGINSASAEQEEMVAAILERDERISALQSELNEAYAMVELEQGNAGKTKDAVKQAEADRDKWKKKAEELEQEGCKCAIM